MTSLEDQALYFRRMSTAEHKDECQVETVIRWRRQTVRPDPDCPGCNSEADRRQFAKQADELDAYLNTDDEPMLEMPNGQ